MGKDVLTTDIKDIDAQFKGASNLIARFLEQGNVPQPPITPLPQFPHEDEMTELEYRMKYEAVFEDEPPQKINRSTEDTKQADPSTHPSHLACIEEMVPFNKDAFEQVAKILENHANRHEQLVIKSDARIYELGRDHANMIAVMMRNSYSATSELYFQGFEDRLDELIVSSDQQTKTADEEE